MAKDVGAVPAAPGATSAVEHKPEMVVAVPAAMEEKMKALLKHEVQERPEVDVDAELEAEAEDDDEDDEDDVAEIEVPPPRKPLAKAAVAKVRPKKLPVKVAQVVDVEGREEVPEEGRLRFADDDAEDVE